MMENTAFRNHSLAGSDELFTSMMVEITSHDQSHIPHFLAFTPFIFPDSIFHLTSETSDAVTRGGWYTD